MTAKLLTFSGNPRPRITRPDPAVVLILPEMRIEKENSVVDLRHVFTDFEQVDGPDWTSADWSAAIADIMERCGW